VIYAGTNTVVIATTNNFATGLTGTLGVRVVDLTGATVKTRQTSGIVEGVAGSGFYIASIDLTLTSIPAGHYFVFWDNGSVSPGNTAAEDLILHITTTFATALRQLGAVEATHNAENVAVALIVG
jgi:hypothetical protein